MNKKERPKSRAIKESFEHGRQRYSSVSGLSVPPEHRTRVLSVEGSPRRVGSAAISPCAAAGGRTNFTPFWHPDDLGVEEAVLISNSGGEIEWLLLNPSTLLFVLPFQASVDWPVMA